MVMGRKGGRISAAKFMRTVTIRSLYRLLVKRSPFSAGPTFDTGLNFGSALFLYLDERGAVCYDNDG